MKKFTETDEAEKGISLSFIWYFCQDLEIR